METLSSTRIGSLFSSSDSQQILDRIGRLGPQSKPQWGKMDVVRMLAHCQAPLRVATGDLVLKRSLIGMLFGGMAKKSLLSPKPWKPNMPTAPEFLVKEPREFARERETLVELVQRFTANGPEGLTKHPHPFFGELSVEQWDALMWRHLDHHLRQFGA